MEVESLFTKTEFAAARMFTFNYILLNCINYNYLKLKHPWKRLWILIANFQNEIEANGKTSIMRLWRTYNELKLGKVFVSFWGIFSVCWSYDKRLTRSHSMLSDDIWHLRLSGSNFIDFCFNDYRVTSTNIQTAIIPPLVASLPEK